MLMESGKTFRPNKDLLHGASPPRIKKAVEKLPPANLKTDGAKENERIPPRHNTS